ncbi:TlpA disulfide reductase family protein [Salinicoccus hispanicus]|uniref:Redoxin domain-containing protein n=1 Tax=Salinicoccus hispanicus TaxID=157225 RepID=A0A6N8U0A9_9STAP|nr:TlpA disulfide reductase family protein [Salinicoccus hispanicus]MXQ50737.1 redoxin domain-containing protein [Salinicoccus hispanicus]
MKKKSVLIILVLAVFFLIVGAGIAAVINMSEEGLREQSLETLQNSEGRDNHHAVGMNIMEEQVEGIINDSESLGLIIRSNEVTVINFFASWCDPCRRETPELNEFYQSHQGEPVEIVGINVDDKAANRDAFLEEFDVQYPIYEFSDESASIDAFKINLMPTTFFVDQEGEVIRAYIGEVEQKLINNYINYVKEES